MENTVKQTGDETMSALTIDGRPCAKLCACDRMKDRSKQCFRCQQIDNEWAGKTFGDEMEEWKDWFGWIEGRTRKSGDATCEQMLAEGVIHVFKKTN